MTTKEMVELKVYGNLAIKKFTRRQPTRHQERKTPRLLQTYFLVASWLAKSRLLGSDFVGGEMTEYRTETPGGWIPLLKETQQLSNSNSYITNHKEENVLVSSKQSHRNAPMTQVVLQETIRNEGLRPRTH